MQKPKRKTVFETDISCYIVSTILFQVHLKNNLAVLHINLGMQRKYILLKIWLLKKLTCWIQISWIIQWNEMLSMRKRFNTAIINCIRYILLLLLISTIIRIYTCFCAIVPRNVGLLCNIVLGNFLCIPGINYVMLTAENVTVFEKITRYCSQQLLHAQTLKMGNVILFIHRQ